MRASEIGAFIFCQRAWWYQRQEQPPINQHELAAGSQFHHRHIGRIRAALVLRALSWLLLLAALVVAVVTIVFLLRSAL